MTWTTIPRWLYQNDLSDAELQEAYTEAARRKVAELRARRDAAPPRSYERKELGEMLGRAEAFLQEAEAKLAYYRGRQGYEAPRLRATIKALPNP
jgi:hypothetical protein